MKVRSSFSVVALVFGLMCVIALPGSALAQAIRVHGVVMPPDAIPVEEDRFRSKQTYSRTLRYFSRQYRQGRGVIWQAIRGSPRVKGVHIVNHRARRTWDGINIYETGDKVYIYVVKARPTAEKKR